jgi:hypothetical protein
MNNDDFLKILTPLNGKFVEVTNYSMLRPDFEYSKSLTKLELHFDPKEGFDPEPVDKEEQRMLLLAKRREYHAQRAELINSQKRALYEQAKRTKKANPNER